MANSENKEQIDYVAYNDGLDYWSYIYASLNVKCYCDDELKNAMKNVSILEKYHEEDMFTVRCMINGTIRLRENLKTSFAPCSLTSQEFEAVTNICCFTIPYIYYPWDIMKCPTGETLAEFVLKNEHLPLPPLILSVSESTQRRGVSRMIHDDFIPDFSKDFIAEISQVKYIVELSPMQKNYDNGKCIKEIDYNQSKIQMINKKINNNITGAEAQEFAKKRKIIEKTPYRAKRGDWERIIGLILLEIQSEHQGITFTELLEKFRKQDIYWEIEDALVFTQKDKTLTSREPWVIERWLDSTIHSVQQGKIVSISNKVSK